MNSRRPKKFVTRESNPGQVDGNDLCYHYTSDEWMSVEATFVLILYPQLCTSALKLVTLVVGTVDMRMELKP